MGTLGVGGLAGTSPPVLHSGEPPTSGSGHKSQPAASSFRGARRTRSLVSTAASSRHGVQLERRAARDADVGARQVLAQRGELGEEALLDADALFEREMLLDEGDEEEREDGEEPRRAVGAEDGRDEGAQRGDGVLLLDDLEIVSSSSEQRVFGARREERDDGEEAARRGPALDRRGRVAAHDQLAVVAAAALGRRGRPLGDGFQPDRFVRLCAQLLRAREAVLLDVRVGRGDVGVVEGLEVVLRGGLDAALPDGRLGPDDLELEADARLVLDAPRPAEAVRLGDPAVLDGEAVAVRDVLHRHDGVHDEAAVRPEGAAALHLGRARRRRADGRPQAPLEPQLARVLRLLLGARRLGPRRHRHLGVALLLVEPREAPRRAVGEKVLEELVDRDGQRRRRQLVRERAERRDAPERDDAPRRRDGRHRRPPRVLRRRLEHRRRHRRRAARRRHARDDVGRRGGAAARPLDDLLLVPLRLLWRDREADAVVRRLALLRERRPLLRQQRLRRRRHGRPRRSDTSREVGRVAGGGGGGVGAHPVLGSCCADRAIWGSAARVIRRVTEVVSTARRVGRIRAARA
mmetsp:Transcript_25806/g.103077  ORF Transcript_25806/g.103077 Transcript_25806/m.103077 type:complete len:577 (-) Transcript_25806:91-1821(-)